MPCIHRHPHTGAWYQQFRNLENLAALVAKLDLFLGVTVFDNLIVERHYIECDGNSPFFWRWKIEGSAVAHKGRGVDSRVPHLGLQLAYASNTSARYSLIRANHHSLQAGGLMQWLEHRHCRHRCAIRICHDSPLNRLECVRVDFGDNERELQGGRRARGEESDIEARVISRRCVLDENFCVLPPQVPASRACRGK